MAESIPNSSNPMHNLPQPQPMATIPAPATPSSAAAAMALPPSNAPLAVPPVPCSSCTCSQIQQPANFNVLLPNNSQAQPGKKNRKRKKENQETRTLAASCSSTLPPLAQPVAAEIKPVKCEDHLPNFPQPQLPAPAATATAPVPAPAPAPAPASDEPAMAQSQASPAVPFQDPLPQANVTNLPSSSSNRLPESLMYKNRLQEYTQRSSIPLPAYQTVNEGFPHAPKFRSTVIVDGTSYTSPNAFSHRKAAEQDVAKLALECILKKIKDEGSPLIREDTVFCKSILSEFAVKMNLPRPVYYTVQPEALIPVFASSLVFNGVTYTGYPGKNKKEAEQLAARAVILSLMGTSGCGTILYEIIKSKGKLFAALYKGKDPNSAHNSFVSEGVNSGTSYGITHSQDKLIEASMPIDYQPLSAIPETTVGVHPPHHEFKVPKPELSSAVMNPSTAFVPPVQQPFIAFVPPVQQQPLELAPYLGKKRNRKNKKKANKKVQVDAQLPVATLPLNQAPTCSVAQ